MNGPKATGEIAEISRPESTAAFQPAYHYDAFISYRRLDGADLSQWLRRKLQDYRLPQSLALERKPLRVYLDTTFGRANEDFWKQNIEPALRHSRFLIVVLTPGVFQPRSDGTQNWVEREIELFLSLPQARNVVVVQGAGNPNDRLPSSLQNKYPRIFIVDLSKFQHGFMFPARRVYLNDQILSLIASFYGLADIHMPILRQEQQRRRRKLLMRVASLLLILTVLTGIFGQKLHHWIEDAQEKKRQAEEQLTASYVEQGRQELLQGQALRALPYLSAAYSLGNASSELRFMLAQAMRPVDALVSTLKDYGHHARVHSAIFSPDGDRVFTASEDGTVEIWDTISRRDPGSTWDTLNKGQVMAVSPDGALLVTAGKIADKIVTADNKYKVILWTTGTKEFVQPWLLELMGAHDGAVNSAAFSPDGKRIVTASIDETARIWDTETRKLRFTLHHHPSVVNAASFSWDSKLVVTASNDGARIWDAARGICLHTLTDHHEAVVAATFSRNNKFVVTASEDGIARIWDAMTGKLLRALSPHRRSLVTAAFNPEGTRVITASKDGTAKIWDAATGDLLHTLKHDGPVAAAALSEDGRLLVTASGGQAKIWDAVTGYLRLSLDGHSDAVLAVAFSRDGSKVVTASADGTAKVWQTNISPLLRILDGQTGPVRSVGFSHDSKLVITGMADGAATICDAATGKVLHTLPDPTDKKSRHTDKISAAAFSVGDKWVMTASRDGTAKIWDSATGDLKLSLGTRAVDIGVGDPGLIAAAFSTSETLLTADRDGKIKTWDTTNGTVLFDWGDRNRAAKGFLAFSPNGRSVMFSDEDGTTRILDAATRGTVYTWRILDGPAQSAAFSPDSKWIIADSSRNEATIWEATMGKARKIPASSSPVSTVAISPDGALVVTAGSTLQVWGLKLDDYDGNVNAAAFNLDGTRLVTGGDKGARVWEMRLETRPPADIARLIHCRVPWILSADGRLSHVSPDGMDMDCTLRGNELRDKKN